MKVAPLAFATLALFVGIWSPLHAQPTRGGRASHGSERTERRDDDESPQDESAKAAADPVYAAPVALVSRFDRNGDGRLDAAERAAARDFLAAQPAATGTGANTPRSAAPSATARTLEPVKPGAKVDVAALPDLSARPLYDPATLRTIALAFDDTDWERQLALFASTDIWVPARVTIDGRTYPGVGVRYAPLPVAEPRDSGYKRTLLLRFDFTDPQQRLAGQRELRLLDVFADPTFVRTSLGLDVARESALSAPRSNFVTVAINGENWGVYANVQPFDERFLLENFGTAAGARWTVAAGGGLTYLGDDPQPYRAIYHLDTEESPAAWQALIKLCRTLAQTDPEDLEPALAPLLDVNGALRFLAWENVLMNQGGYRAHGGGYGLYLDPAGRFHLIPLAAETAFRLVETETYERYGGRAGARFGDGNRERPSGRGGARGNREAAAATTSSPPAPASNSPGGAAPTKTPRQQQTDLAMLLSYSFVLKADRDDDQRVTRGEWLDFARGWFTVMDENFAGQLGRAQLIDKFRWFVTPPSMRDGKSRQTYGQDDPAEVIGGEFFAEMDQDHDGQVTRDEFVGAFDRWFTRWMGAKTQQLAQPQIQAGLEKMLPESVFVADANTAAKRDRFIVSDERPDAAKEREGGRGGERGGGRGAGGSGLSLGLPIPGLHVGTDSFRRRSEGGAGGRTLVIQREQLDVLAGADNPRRPLIQKLLAPIILRWRYYGYVHGLASTLTWERLGAMAKQRYELIGAEVERDTHKPDSYEHFIQRLDQDLDSADAEPSLKNIVTERRRFVLDDEFVQRHPDGK
ncbi:MAG: CotH kinase family protein [Candidatus Didemnitutus sp.]|nr:CotH kinase family protein [Candidatus Didemnitutus sp.]